MRCRINSLRKNLFSTAVRLVIHALASLVLDYVSLRIEFLDIQRVEQVTHAVRFDPQRGLEVIARNSLEINRAIVGGGAVIGSSDALRQLVVQAIRHMTRS